MKKYNTYTYDFIRADSDTNWSQGTKKSKVKTITCNIPILTKYEQYTDVDDPVRLKSKIIFPREFGYNVYVDTSGQYALPQQAESIITDKSEEIFSYFNSKIIRFIMKECSWVPQSDFYLLRLIPKVEDKIWTDEELYNHFKLTHSEIDLIEKTTK